MTRYFRIVSESDDTRDFHDLVVDSSLVDALQGILHGLAYKLVVIQNPSPEDRQRIQTAERLIQVECDHDYDPNEGNMCLNCGKDGTEDLACAAEAYWDAMEDR